MSKSARKQRIAAAVKRAEDYTLTEQVAHDVEGVQAVLERPEALLLGYTQGETFTSLSRVEQHVLCAAVTAEERDAMVTQLPADKLAEYNNEKKRADVITRLGMMIGGGDMQLADTNGRRFEAATNGLPIACHLAAHGGRVMVEIPPTGGNDDQTHQMFNWITTGTVAGGTHLNEAVSLKHSGQKAQEEGEGKIFFNRLAATHSVTIHDDGTLTEKKENPARELFADVIPALCGKETRHWGMNVAMGGYGQQDIHGNMIAPEGAHGHLYLYYQPPTADKPGAIMFGIENCAPNGQEGPYGSHSLLGKPDVTGAMGGAKWEGMHSKLAASDDPAFQATHIPHKYGGQTVTLTREKIADITGENTEEHRHTIAANQPGRNMADIRQNLTEINLDEPARPARVAEQAQAVSQSRPKTVDMPKVSIRERIGNFFREIGNKIKGVFSKSSASSVVDADSASMASTSDVSIADLDAFPERQLSSVEMTAFSGTNRRADRAFRDQVVGSDVILTEEQRGVVVGIRVDARRTGDAMQSAELQSKLDDDRDPVVLSATKEQALKERNVE